MFAFEMNAELVERVLPTCQGFRCCKLKSKRHIFCCRWCKKGLIKNALSTNATKEEFITAVSKYLM
jgi:hypothetical protein